MTPSDVLTNWLHARQSLTPRRETDCTCEKLQGSGRHPRPRTFPVLPQLQPQCCACRRVRPHPPPASAHAPKPATSLSGSSQNQTGLQSRPQLPGALRGAQQRPTTDADHCQQHRPHKCTKHPIRKPVPQKVTSKADEQGMKVMSLMLHRRKDVGPNSRSRTQLAVGAPVLAAGAVIPHKGVPTPVARTVHTYTNSSTEKLGPHTHLSSEKEAGACIECRPKALA